MTVQFKLKSFQSDDNKLVARQHSLNKRDLIEVEVQKTGENSPTIFELSPLESLSDESLTDALDDFIFAMKNSDDSDYPSTDLTLSFLRSLDYNSKKNFEVSNNQLIANPILFLKEIQNGKKIIHPGSVLKLKLRPMQFDKLLEALAEIHSILPATVKLRGDGNQALAIDHVLELYKIIPGERWEYFEDPVADIQKYSSRLLQHQIPIALDETFLSLFRSTQFQPEKINTQLLELKNKFNLEALVLKPTLIGKYQRVLTVAQLAHELGVKTILSSCYEGPVGIKQLGFVAEKINQIYNENLVHGLELAEIFKQTPSVTLIDSVN